MRVVIRARSKDELLKRLCRELDKDVTEVYINMRPTKEVVVTILDNAPNVRRISCPYSLYPKVSKRILRALREMGIELAPEKTRRGRPRKYGEQTLRLVRNLVKRGENPREVSVRTGIPLRTVYYIIKTERVRKS